MAKLVSALWCSYLFVRDVDNPIACGGPEPNEIDSAAALESQGLNFTSCSFLFICSFALLPSVALCFHRLSALPAHSPAGLSYNPLQTVPLPEVGM